MDESIIDRKMERLWKEFSAKLKQFILKRVSSLQVAEDILQEVFIKIHSRIYTLRDESKLQNWIYQITRNTIIDYFQAMKPLVRNQKILSLDSKENYSDIQRDNENPKIHRSSSHSHFALLSDEYYHY